LTLYANVSLTRILEEGRLIDSMSICISDFFNQVPRGTLAIKSKILYGAGFIKVALHCRFMYSTIYSCGNLRRLLS